MLPLIMPFHQTLLVSTILASLHVWLENSKVSENSWVSCKNAHSWALPHSSETRDIQVEPRVGIFSKRLR